MQQLSSGTVLCLDPLRFEENEALIHQDNIVTTITLNKVQSPDSLATTVIRATRIIAAGIGCQLFSIWEKKRLWDPTRIADYITHNLSTEFSSYEIHTFASGPCQLPRALSSVDGKSRGGSTSWIRLSQMGQAKQYGCKNFIPRLLKLLLNGFKSLKVWRFG